MHPLPSRLPFEVGIIYSVLFKAIFQPNNRLCRGERLYLSVTLPNEEVYHE